ncbi:hypothetical protein C8Q70DRAFT_683958 [Cubamyces menziesii]|uniref:F-box domain-containing protein n=1 Tax=Trametes cubensis TaxID=1111947 RepID=A0AAD7THQ7_9APHY|nr:hypothetical protein C8Q70DRAFT_683958 [Cubamyces menziesii]KAJ8457698.1 hypothetical protein ONZ51_g11378 [Trametes cubensis]
MELLDLPEDVLHVIVSYLRKKNALNLALTTKRLSGLALPRIAAVAECHAPADLRRLQKYLLSRRRSRAHCLRSLIVSPFTFYPDDDEYDPDDWLRSLGNAADNFQDFTQAPYLIADILVRCHNICHLDLERFQPCLRRDRRIGTALVAMTGLKRLSLGVLGDTVVSLLQSCQSGLTYLKLWYHDERGFQLQGEPKTFPVLLATLSHFRSLQSLELCSFTPSEPISAAQISMTPQFPSITHLRLSEALPQALSLVSLCPNLRTLIFSLAIDGLIEQHLSTAPLLRGGPRWRPLQHLRLGNHQEISCVLDHIDKVDILHFISALPSIDPQKEPFARFLRFLRVTSPVELYLPLALTNSSIGSLWEQVVQCAPRLRILDLKVSTSRYTYSSKCDKWLDTLLATLGILPIVCLRLYVHPVSCPIARGNVPVGFSYRCNYHEEPDDSRMCADARKMERRRIETMPTLPQRLMDAVPSLRYLALIDSQPNNTSWDVGADDEWPITDGGDDDYQAPHWDEVRETDWTLSTCWWRVVEGSLGRTLETISAEEAERVQHQIIQEAAVV